MQVLKKLLSLNKEGYLGEIEERKQLALQRDLDWDRREEVGPLNGQSYEVRVESMDQYKK